MNLLKTIATILICLLSLPAFSQWNQIGEDIDGANESDRAGWSVTLSGDGSRLVMFDPFFDGLIEDIGRIRVFELNGSSWDQLGQDIIEEEAPGYFAASKHSIDINDAGTRIVVGGPNFDGIEGVLGFESGIVRVFEFNGSTWEQLGQTLTGGFNGDTFGFAVSMNAVGDRIAVGAPSADDNGNASGQVKIFDFNGTVWEQLGQNINGIQSGIRSGSSISLDGDGSRVAISASIAANGHVKILELVDTTWIQLGPIINNTGTFAQSVDLSFDGNIFAVGSEFNELESGGIKVFKFIQGTWVQLGQDINGNINSFLGGDVSLRSDGLCVAIGGQGMGVTGLPVGDGDARVYHFDGQVWNQFQPEMFENIMDDGFGFSVSLSADGSTLAVGAPFADDNIVGENAGYVRVFTTGFVGVKENTLLADFKIYPNPTQGHLMIEFETLQNLDVRLLSTTGQILKRQKIINSEKFDFNIDGPNGIYFIELIDEEQRSAVFEVVKEER